MIPEFRFQLRNQPHSEYFLVIEALPFLQAKKASWYN